MANGEIEIQADIHSENEEVEVFNFDSWSQECGLSRKTTQLLYKEDLTTKNALLLLGKVDIDGLSLTLGQRKVMQAAIKDLQMVKSKTLTQKEDVSPSSDQTILGAANVTNGTVNPDHQEQTFDLPCLRTQNIDLLTPGKNFNELITESQNLKECSNKSQFTSRLAFDPRAILSMKARRQKALHITEFLPETTKRRRQSRRKDLVLTTRGTNEDQVVIKTEEDHPYSGIYLSEWGAANCRLMNALLERGLLARSEVEFYLAYTTKIFEWSQKYELESVLEYDYRYRELQAEHGFKWGVVSPDMELYILERHQNQKHQYRRPGIRKYNRAPLQTQSATEGNQPIQTQECGMFKATGRCSFGADCRYIHPTKINEPKYQINERQ